MILSLFDRSGVWPRHYAEAGERVVTVDLWPALPGTMYPRREHFCCDIRAIGAHGYGWGDVRICLMAPPCTHFANSGARWFAEKDRDGRTNADVALVNAALLFVSHSRPSIWALENPIGRLRRLIPELGAPPLTFDPCDYGDPWTKRTQVFGRFNPDLPRSPVPAMEFWGWRKLGGKSERTKILRSTTPAGFARAFHEANQ